jgi:type I restriction enzyme R subunit
MTRGIAVAGGDRLGKTIIFARNQAHADFIAECFDANYPHWKGEFARVITFKTEYAQSLIDAFAQKDKAPHIVISVDMLDTGIDVPEIVNLVFFKRVHSKTKFWQMIGRGTRLCPDLFGPGQVKHFFYLFVYCQNLEYFGQNPPTTEGVVTGSVSKRLFTARLSLIGELDPRIAQNGKPGVTDVASAAYADPASEAEVRADTAHLLNREVAAMNLDNFVIRPHRRAVEKYAKPEAWTVLSAEALADLAHEIAGLPSELPSENEEAKRFDLLLLGLQLTVLTREPGFERLRDRVKAIAGLLEEKSTIPMVREQMALIQDVQADEWWQDVTVPMLERVRRRLRDLVQFIDKGQRKLVYTDFEDVIGDGSGVELPGFHIGTDSEKFRAKAQAFLRDHLDHITIAKLRMNRALTHADLAELERMLAASGAGTANDIERAKEESHGLGLFVRSLVGLDREAAKAALGVFLDDKTLAANQIEFVNLIVDHLTERGVLTPAALYESPFTDIAATGPDAIFEFGQV